MIELELPMPPSVNKLYANVRGRRIMTSKGKTVKHEIRQATTKQLASKPSLFTQETPLRLTVDLYFSAVENKGWPKKQKAGINVLTYQTELSYWRTHCSLYSA